MDPGENAIRLNKFLAQCGVASRRGADELILAGAVTVNGAPVAEAGARVDPERDVVTVHGRPVALPQADTPLTLALHKPVQVVTTVRDPQGRRTVLDFLPPDIRAQRPFPVGRLDFLSEGLLLLTTDGELCNRLTHPRHHVHKTYRVRVCGQIPARALDIMRGGMTLEEGERLAPVETRVLSETRGETLLEMTLIQGVNRQIRRMCRDLGLSVLQLTRVAQGPVRLGGLKPGTWRKLNEEEETALRRAVGLL
ncbi:pseudouridine synthase [Desulfovibrio aminophilus]|uniref:pseudouridine synthase n=1 Tax=Desulfovibrio aminophilus TaxID=81425 RepID=UPI003395F8D2